MSSIRDFFPIFDFCGYVTGDIAIFPFNNEPDGFFECDGRTLPISDYGPLHSMLGNVYGGDGVTTFAIPDYRGLFLRGMDDGVGLDPNLELRTTILGDTGDNIGSVQPDMLEYHSHGIPGNYNTGVVIPTQHGGRWDTDEENGGWMYFLYEGGNETRPRNISVMFAIKY